MAKVGRISSAEEAAGRIHSAKRPEPPAALDQESATEWRRVVDAMPPDWFAPETLALLETRCQHVVWARKTSELLNELLKKKKMNVKEYDSLLRQAQNQARVLMQLDTAMRLTQQSSYDRGKRKGTAARSAQQEPWQQQEKSWQKSSQSTAQ